jgi:hypothetical protein
MTQTELYQLLDQLKLNYYINNRTNTLLLPFKIDDEVLNLRILRDFNWSITLTIDDVLTVEKPSIEFLKKLLSNVCQQKRASVVFRELSQQVITTHKKGSSATSSLFAMLTKPNLYLNAEWLIGKYCLNHQVVSLHMSIPTRDGLSEDQLKRLIYSMIETIRHDRRMLRMLASKTDNDLENTQPIPSQVDEGVRHLLGGQPDQNENS